MVVTSRLQRSMSTSEGNPGCCRALRWVKALLATCEAPVHPPSVGRPRSGSIVFPSRIHDSPHLGTRQYARILEHWVDELGLDPADYGTHSMRRTKATLIYRRMKNLRAVQLLLGHSKLESTVRYLGIEMDDALEISEQTEI